MRVLYYFLGKIIKHTAEKKHTAAGRTSYHEPVIDALVEDTPIRISLPHSKVRCRFGKCHSRI